MNLNVTGPKRNTKLSLIQDLIPLGLMHVGEVLSEEVRALAGDSLKRPFSLFRSS